MFFLRDAVQGLATLRANPESAAGPNKKPFATTAGNLCAA